MKDTINMARVERFVSNWQRQVETANKYNKPGEFTTLIAFEWTSIPDSQNLHRNVFFRDDVGPEVPFSAFDSVDPEDLWTYLENYEEKTGGSVLAIAHNGNVSNGQMFPLERTNGEPIDAEYAERDGTEPIGIVCAVCHDPHDARNHGQLRFPIDVPEVDVNLCMKCHQRRAVPDPTSSRGPHSPQGPLLLGENVGWQPPNFQYADIQIRSTHGSDANPRLCATCHVNSYEVTDAATGDFVSSGQLRLAEEFVQQGWRAHLLRLCTPR